MRLRNLPSSSPAWCSFTNRAALAERDGARGTTPHFAALPFAAFESGRGRGRDPPGGGHRFHQATPALHQSAGLSESTVDGVEGLPVPWLTDRAIAEKNKVRRERKVAKAGAGEDSSVSEEIAGARSAAARSHFDRALRQVSGDLQKSGDGGSNGVAGGRGRA